ncbi:MAG: sulfotransferase domain-containing protein [Desulfobacteraceae bacterium]|nr:sulfotransferase domain-containing protein [Desulfobacteraceae bacterium]
MSEKHLFNNLKHYIFFISARGLLMLNKMKLNHTNILVNCLPKSSSLYIVRTIAETISCDTIRLGSRGVNYSQIDPVAAYNFCLQKKNVSQDHIAPTKFNLDILYYSGITKFILIFRDPRDALVSWVHHLEREDAAGVQWHRNLLYASGIISEFYYDLTWNEKIDDLIKHYYPIMIEWMRGWELLSRDERFSIKIKTYEEFLEDKTQFIEDILEFYGLLKEYQKKIIWPKISARKSNNICLDTHFRKGVSGSHLSEFSVEQIKSINAKKDQNLFRQFNWR